MIMRFGLENKIFKLPNLKAEQFNNFLKKVIWKNENEYTIVDDVVDIEKCLSFREFLERNLNPDLAKTNEQKYYGVSLGLNTLTGLNQKLKTINNDLELKKAEFLKQQNEALNNNNNISDDHANINNPNSSSNLKNEGDKK